MEMVSCWDKQWENFHWFVVVALYSTVVWATAHIYTHVSAVSWLFISWIILSSCTLQLQLGSSTLMFFIPALDISICWIPVFINKIKCCNYWQYCTTDHHHKSLSFRECSSCLTGPLPVLLPCKKCIVTQTQTAIAVVINHLNNSP